MPRVIYAWNYVEWGGAQIHFLALIKEARKSFDTVIVLPTGTDKQFLGFIESEGIRYESFQGNIDLGETSGVAQKLKRHWTRVKSEHAMLRKIREVGLKDSVVHIDISPASSLFSLVWLCLQTNVFITLHNAFGTVPKWRWALWKLKYAVVSLVGNIQIFCTNVHAANYFEKLFSGTAAREIKITYDSINPSEIEEARNSEFDRKLTLQKLDVDPSKFVVLTVGQFIDRKGRWTLLEAARTIRDTRSDLVFIWVTPTLPIGADAARVAGFDLGDVLKIVRSADVADDRKGILRFFKIADVFVLPSFVEGIPIALLEAMAMGQACISTNVYGIPEAIVHEETGLLIEPGDAKALADEIVRLFRDKPLRDKLGRNARKRAITVFDEKIAAETAVNAYEKVFRSRSDSI